MKKIVVTSLFAFLFYSGFSQQNVTFTFTGVDNTRYSVLDKVKVINRTQYCDTVLYWPDTVLNFSIVGIPENKKTENKLSVFQNHPNPVFDYTSVSIFVPKLDELEIFITDLAGRTVITETYRLDKGIHDFRFMTGNSKAYIFTAKTSKEQSSIKMLSNSHTGNQEAVLTYSGIINTNSGFKNSQDLGGFSFMPGDELIIVGNYNTLESGILDYPLTSKNYVFQFASNIPCPDMPTITYGGQVYNTVQIFSQCWMSENLNYESGNSWCYDYDPGNCNSYGRLYDWETALTVCPPGWHLPSDAELKILEGTVDSQYGVGHPEWDEWGSRGYDVSKNLKSNFGWNNNGNGTNLYGFSLLPAGRRDAWNGRNFQGIGEITRVWASDEWSNSGMTRSFNFGDRTTRTFSDRGFGWSVRCLRD